MPTFQSKHFAEGAGLTMQNFDICMYYANQIFKHFWFPFSIVHLHVKNITEI